MVVVYQGLFKLRFFEFRIEGNISFRKQASKFVGCFVLVIGIASATMRTDFGSAKNLLKKIEKFFRNCRLSFAQDFSLGL